MRPQLWIGVGIVAALVATGAAGYMVTNKGFDAARWKAERNSGARDNPRAGMIGYVKELLRPGMTRDEVLALLGEPETRSSASVGLPDTEHSDRFVYDLGMHQFYVDYVYFVIEFDEQGRLRRHFTIEG